MTHGHYGIIFGGDVDDSTAGHVEELALRGFTVVPNILPSDTLAFWRGRLDEIYGRQEAAFGRAALASIQEVDMCRAPLLHDFEFMQLAMRTSILPIVRCLLGNFIILQLQNGIINRPGLTHHQASWHRDLPYQNFVTSRPLAISALVTLDEFTPETGGTQVLPFTHKMERMPSATYIAAHAVTVSAPAGAAILFDSMLLHRAGANSSTATRRGVNHVYTVPIIKQQYDFPSALQGRTDLSAEQRELLGFTSAVARDDDAWRRARFDRLGRPIG